LKKLQVIYGGWGERWPLGVLADTGRVILFEYSAEAIERGMQLSPLHHPLPRAGAATAAFKGEPHFSGLPGFIADALPDGWGLMLMDRALRRVGRNPQQVSVLERLAIVGDRALGALAFEPALDDPGIDETLQLKKLASEILAQQNEDDSAPELAAQRLRHLMQLGGSPQGARPKVLADFDPATGILSSGILRTDEARPWLVKFPAQGEHREVCALEELYARIARHMGIEMPVSQFFDLGRKSSAFGIERFDRVRQGPDPPTMRVPVLSLSGYLQANFRIPSLDYETVLLATQRITGDQREVIKAFARCVFNVVMHNRDDHGRNFAFRMNAQGRWELSPAFDLTYSSGPGGEHCTSVAGQGTNITREHLMQIAKNSGIATKVAQQVINHNIAAAVSAPGLLGDLPIRHSTWNEWVKGSLARVRLLG
jgi:serine/threonine-protein kinase HipA